MKQRSEVMQTLCAGFTKAEPQTNTQTDRDNYNTLCTLCSLAHSVIKQKQIITVEGLQDTI